MIVVPLRIALLGILLVAFGELAGEIGPIGGATKECMWRHSRTQVRRKSSMRFRSLLLRCFDKPVRTL